MKFLQAVRRCEELAYELEAARKTNARQAATIANLQAENDALNTALNDMEAKAAALKKKVEEQAATLEVRFKKIGNLIKDNGRLLAINQRVCEWKGVTPATRRLDENGDPIQNRKK